MHSKATTPLLISIILILLIALGFFFYRTSVLTQQTDDASLSGTFDINGTVPKGASVTLSQKEAYTKDPFQQFASGINARDQGAWRFTDAKANASYEISATLIAHGKTIATAAPISITAPATDEVLVFNIPAATPTGVASISGTVDLNGYIPDNATIAITGRTPDTDYSIVSSDIKAKENAPFTYDQAISGQSYTLQAILYDESGTVIGTSAELTVTAPAKHETFSINSTAQPSVPLVTETTPTAKPQTVTISGTIDFNGASQQNTRIVIFERIAGSNDTYQVAQDNISPQNGATWHWSNALAGTSYDLVAVLKQRQSNGTDKDIATSQTLSVAAPATNEQFTLNSGFVLPVQNGQITTSCTNYDPENNTWSGNVTFQAIPNAQSYWIQIGTTNGGDQLTNNTTNASDQGAMTFDYTFKDNTTYYARYAYSYMPNLLAYSTQFSPFSQTAAFTCSL